MSVSQHVFLSCGQNSTCEDYTVDDSSIAPEMEDVTSGTFPEDGSKHDGQFFSCVTSHHFNVCPTLVWHKENLIAIKMRSEYVF